MASLPPGCRCGNRVFSHLPGCPAQETVQPGSSINVTASFGVAWLSSNSDTAERLLNRADEALYTAKQAGRNRLEYAATG
jgi:diguanylate cyclase (GGDEF)-like protein